MCGRCTVYNSRRLPGDNKFLASERNTHSGTMEEKIHCSRQGEDFHDSQSRVEQVSHDVTSFPVHTLVCHWEDEEEEDVGEAG